MYALSMKEQKELAFFFKYSGYACSIKVVM